MSRILARVKGMVQGVGFRYFIMHKATTYGLQGYVRNCHDGDVEVEAEGNQEKLLSLIEDLRQGPHLCEVKDVEVEWFEEEKGYQTFTLKA